MQTEQMIKELRRLEEKHKNDKIFTGGMRWSDMCRDVADRLEKLSKSRKSIFEELDKKSFPVDMGHTETKAVRLVDIEDALLN